MSTSELSYQDLLDIVKLIEASPDINDFHLKYGEIELHLSKTGAAPPLAVADAPATPAPMIAAVPAARAAPPPPAAHYPAGAALVKSPMVGTYYHAPEPGATPFVTLGQRVTAETTVCIIEVMKLMNSITAGQAGVVTHILVDDGAAVDFNQVLLVIDTQG